MMMREPPNRRPSEQIELDFATFRFVFSVGYHPDTGIPCEVFISERGKPGDLNDALYELGIAISKTLQGELYERVGSSATGYPVVFGDRR
jgi:hypothetical protein